MSGMPEKKTAGSGGKKVLPLDNKMKAILLLGIAGMALILISQFAGSSDPPDQVDTATAQFTSQEYAAQLEEKLTEIISGIDGVGRAQVMVTLETGVEYVYAQEEKRNVDKTTEGGAEEVMGRVQEKENVEQTYILVENHNGRKQPLLTTELQPKIQGVIIVCEGADDVRVEQSLINVVTTALNIPSTRVCVVKIS